MNCASCGAGNQVEFPSEVNIHISSLKNRATPSVLVFPNLVVCLDCGFTQSTLSERDLNLLRKGLAPSDVA
jgi:hypothetical protein